jgi:hypothetical protein
VLPEIENDLFASSHEPNLHTTSVHQERAMSIFGKIMSAIFGTSATATPASGGAAAPASAGAASAGGSSAPGKTVDVAPILDKAVAA